MIEGEVDREKFNQAAFIYMLVCLFASARLSFSSNTAFDIVQYLYAVPLAFHIISYGTLPNHLLRSKTIAKL